MNEAWLQLLAGEGAGETGGETAAPETGAENDQTPDPAAAHWQRVDRIYGEMMQKAESLREVFPDFDIRRELQNPTFALAMRCGMEPECAYLAAHAAEILPAAMAYGAQYAREQLASSLMGGEPSGRKRPVRQRRGADGFRCELPQPGGI